MRNRNNKRNWNNQWRKNFSSSTLSNRHVRKSASSSVEQVDSAKQNYKNQAQSLGSYNPEAQRIESLEQLQYNVQNPYDGSDVRNLPRHLFRPFNAQSVDIRNLAVLNVGETFRVLEFTCPPSASVFFIGYGVFSDAFLETDVEFVPKVNGKRIFTFHGNPGDNYRISLGLAPDLSNSALIECYLQLRPGDHLTWDIINGSAVEISAGVRMKGYLDAANLQVEQQFGG